MIIQDLKLNDRVRLVDGTSGTVIALFSQTYKDWSDEDQDFMYVTDNMQIRSAEIGEIIKTERL